MPQQPYGSPQQPYGVPQQPYGSPQQPYQGYLAPGQHPYLPYPGQGAWPPAARDPSLAEWWQRLLARLIDVLVVSAIVSPAYVVLLIAWVHKIENIISKYPASGPPPPAAALDNAVFSFYGILLLILAATALITFGYDWLQHGLWGATLGKRALGTRVVTAGTRSRISGGAACGRAAVYGLVPGVPLAGGLFALLNELWLLWDPQRQCLHDKAARTVVIKAGAAGGQAGAAGGQVNSSV